MNVPTDPSQPQFVAAISTETETRSAIADVCSQVRDGFESADLGLMFVTPHHGPDFEFVARGICEQFHIKHLLGCTGESIVGNEREVEAAPALALWLARLPGAQVHSMHLEYQETPEGASIVGWPDDLPDPWPPGAALITLGDPFSFATDNFLQRINDDHPQVQVVGGMASGGWGEGKNRLILNRQELAHGAVAALVHGAVRIHSVVSQGCRPIGRHMVVTRSNRQVIQELAGRPPLAHLEEIYQSLSASEQQLIQRGLHLGRAISEYKERFERGDFLIRNVVGADPGSGSIAITDFVRPGQTVQFHIRDARTADEDLNSLLARTHSSCPNPLGALLFTCNGRGTRLFDEPNHDAAAVRHHLGNIPTAGFFAQGEIGPVGGQNFIHGFTACVVLFEAWRQAVGNMQ